MEGSWVKRTFLALKSSRSRDLPSGLRVVFEGLTEQEAGELLVNFLEQIFEYLLQSGNPADDIMHEIEQLQTPAKDSIRTAYDQIIMQGRAEGFRENNFAVFRKGCAMGLSLNDLMTLTGVPEETAQAWFDLLRSNPDAELPK